MTVYVVYRHYKGPRYLHKDIICVCATKSYAEQQAVKMRKADYSEDYYTVESFTLEGIEQ